LALTGESHISSSLLCLETSRSSVCSLQILPGHSPLSVCWDGSDIPELINQLFGEQRGRQHWVLYGFLSSMFCTSHYHTFSQGILMTPFPQSATPARSIVYSLRGRAPPPPLSNISSFPSIFHLILSACWLDCSDLWGFCPAAWLRALFQHRHLSALSGCWFSHYWSMFTF